MTYQEYMTQVKVSAYLGKPLTGRYVKIHGFLVGLWDGMECVADVRDNSIVLQKNGEWYFEQKLKNEYLWCHYDRVWSFFGTDMGMEVTDTQNFIKSAVEQHLKCRVGTPSLNSQLFSDERWNSTLNVR